MATLITQTHMAEEAESRGWRRRVIWLKKVNHLDEKSLGITDPLFGAHQGFRDFPMSNGPYIGPKTRSTWEKLSEFCFSCF